MTRKIFVIADLHLGHDAIRRHCARPFSTLEEMDDELIKRWNSVVSRGDLVFVVGDFAWRNHGAYLARLSGKKVLNRGNHDKMPQIALRNFTEVHGLLQRRINGRSVVFCHYRLSTWPGSNRGSWHLYGHSHGVLPEPAASPCCDVGVDVWEDEPVPWDAIGLKLEPRMKMPSGDTSWRDLEIEANRLENRAIRERIDGATPPARATLRTHKSAGEIRVR